MAIVGMIPHSAIGLEEPGRTIGRVTLTGCFRVQFVWISFRKLGSILIQNSLQLFTQDLLPSKTVVNVKFEFGSFTDVEISYY